MSTLERNRRDDERQAGDPPGSDDADAQLDRFRAAAGELLRAADDTINKALSGNSEAFLRAHRQQGGQ